MKQIKMSFFKRIFIYLCCTFLLSSSIFASYNTTVYASDVEWDDAAKAGLVIAGTMAFLLFQPEITAAILIPSLVDVGISSVTIGKYIYENSDGTYTISPEFVQAVMDAAEKLDKEGVTDSDIKTQSSGYIYSVTGYGTYNWHNQIQTYTMSQDVKGRCAASMEYSGTDDVSKVPYYNVIFVRTSDDGNSFVWQGVKAVRRDPNGSSYVFNNSSYCLSTVAVSVPLFTSLEAAQNYVITGKGYKDAENYRPTPLFRRHSAYTPTYSGGAVTVNRTVIENITQKITEVDADDSLTDDQKIERLQEYIRSGGTSDIGGGGGTGGGSGDTDYDDNKDLPAGTDLTDTNSWLKKIYLKVCQIYDRMNSAVEDAEQAALKKIQESLDEIIVQLKKIKRWTAIDTVVDGVDAIADWLDLIRGVLKDAKEGAGSAVAAIASGVGDSVDLMAKKFPFSIPWDILFFVSALSAEPQVPYFEIPFNIELSALDITIDYTMELDFSQLQWLSDLSRLLLSMTYAVGLMKLTFGVTSVGKEE